MLTIVQKAVKGNKKAMIKLYEANKNEIFGFCNILLGDIEKAESAVVEIINRSWTKAENMEISTEIEYRYLLVVMTAEYCRKLLFEKDDIGFKMSKIPAFSTFYPDETEFSGDVSKGMEELNTALCCLDKYHRFVYSLWAVGNLNFKEISKIIGQREAVVKYFFCTACEGITNHLKSSEKCLEIEQVKSLINANNKSICVSDSVNKSCGTEIANRTVKSNKKIYFTVLTVFCIFAVGIILFLTLGGGSKNKSETTLDTSVNYYADIEIKDYGTISVKLDQKSAPNTVENFVNLSKEGFYDGLTFHRIIEGFMMQGGDPNGDGTGGSDKNIVGEFAENGYDNELAHTRGAVSMARSSDYDSASSQFFIVQKDSTYLDGQYAVFGYVESGMDIVDKICESAEPTDSNGSISAEAQPIIDSIKIRTE